MNQMQEEPSKDDQAKDKTPPTPNPAGPHAREDLTDYEKTPGTGSLPGGPGHESDIGPN
jgi:hypothetical protein